MTDKRMSRETKVALDGILGALAEHGFELPHHPVAPGGEWASNWCNRDALADALVQAASDHEIRICLGPDDGRCAGGG